MSIKFRGALAVSLTILAGLFHSGAVAATYYVDNAAGLDSNPGTSSAAPWQHCPGDGAATGNAAATLNPGDIVLFHGGVPYNFPAGASDFINIEVSGSSGAPIVYRSGDQANPQWGTSPAFINGANAVESYPTALGIIHIGQQSWVTIDGFTVANATLINNYISCIGGLWQPGQGNVTIQNCTITNTGGDGIYLQGSYGIGPTPANFTISNCVIHDCNAHGVLTRGGFTNVTVTGCNIYNTGAPIYAKSIGGDDLGFFMFNNTPPCDVMSGLLVSNNLLGSSLTKSDIILSVCANGVIVACNTCYGTNVVSDFDCNGCLTNVLFCNNLITNTVSTYEGIWRFAPDYDFAQDNGFKILNNTAICTPSLNGYGATFYFVASSATNNTLYYNFEIENNIISESTVPLQQINLNSAGSSCCVDKATFVCDYNVWNPRSMSAGWCFLVNGTGESGNGGTSYTFTNWQAVMGQDAHSTYAVPNYTNGSCIPALSDRVAFTKGANLTAAGVTTDRRGVLRTGPWAIGCYQTVSPPPGLHVVGQ